MSQADLYMMKGMIASLEPDERVQVENCANEMRVLVRKYGDFGEIALGLVGLEVMVRKT